MMLFPGNCWKLLVALGALAVFASVKGAEAELHIYNIPSGPAEETLKMAAEQGRIELVFATEIIVGIQANSIEGRFSAQEALDGMLEGTPLVVVPVSDGNAFGIINQKMLSETDLLGEKDQLTSETTQESQSEMNLPKKNNWLKTFSAILTLGIIGGPGLAAQEEDNEDEIFDLSPFEVNESDSNGA